jgi:hypothetical protein
VIEVLFIEELHSDEYPLGRQQVYRHLKNGVYLQTSPIGSRRLVDGLYIKRLLAEVSTRIETEGEKIFRTAELPGRELTICDIHSADKKTQLQLFIQRTTRHAEQATLYRRAA